MFLKITLKDLNFLHLDQKNYPLIDDQAIYSERFLVFVNIAFDCADGKKRYATFQLCRCFMSYGDDEQSISELRSAEVYSALYEINQQFKKVELLGRLVKKETVKGKSKKVTYALSKDKTIQLLKTKESFGCMCKWKNYDKSLHIYNNSLGQTIQKQLEQYQIILLANKKLNEK